MTVVYPRKNVNGMMRRKKRQTWKMEILKRKDTFRARDYPLVSELG